MHVPGWWAGALAAAVTPSTSAIPFPAEWITPVSGWSVVAFVVLSIVRGWLVPGKELRYWRDAFFEEQRQKRELMSTVQATRGVLRATEDAVRGDGE